MNAYPMLRRCARHQLPEDTGLWMTLAHRRRTERTITPNLMIVTGPGHACGEACPTDCELEHGTLLPILMVKEG